MKAELRHLTVQPMLERPQLLQVRPAVEAALQYLTVQPQLQGRPPLPKMRSALQAHWLGFGPEPLEAPLETWRQT